MGPTGVPGVGAGLFPETVKILKLADYTINN